MKSSYQLLLLKRSNSAGQMIQQSKLLKKHLVYLSDHVVDEALALVGE